MWKAIKVWLPLLCSSSCTWGPEFTSGSLPSESVEASQSSSAGGLPSEASSATDTTGSGGSSQAGSEATSSGEASSGGAGTMGAGGWVHVFVPLGGSGGSAGEPETSGDTSRGSSASTVVTTASDTSSAAGSSTESSSSTGGPGLECELFGMQTVTDPCACDVAVCELTETSACGSCGGVACVWCAEGVECRDGGCDGG
jgi:hypothetical protein